MLRITQVSQSNSEVVLKIEGRVEGSDVKLLEQELEKQFRETRFIVLQIEGLRHIDREGLVVLKGWVGKIAFLGESIFVRALLVAHGLV